MRMGKRGAAFVIAATMTATLTCLPWSGWMVRQQLRVASGGALPNWASGKMPTASERERERQTAAAHPGDFPLQLAMAYQNRPGIGTHFTPETDPAVETRPTKAARFLWSRRSRFSQDPSLYANMLRYLTADAVRVRREVEISELEPTAKSVTPASALTRSRPQNTPEYLTWFDEAAAAGERLDPENGYFPAMRAIGLFAAHEDSAALAAFHRAAAKPNWEEYSVDEVRGNWRLMKLTYGEPGTMERSGQMAGLLFFHYAALRNAARLATIQAVHAEQQGDDKKGFYLRRDLAHVGALIRVRSPYLIGSILGGCVTRTAQDRPGGASALEKPIGVRDGGGDSKTLNVYCGYLERIGEPQEADFVRAEAASDARLHNIRKQALRYEVLGTESLLPVAGIWITGTALLASAMVILLSGGVCCALSHKGILESRLALPLVIFLSIAAVGGTMVLLGLNVIKPWEQWMELLGGMATCDENAPMPTIWSWTTLRMLLPLIAGLTALAVPVAMIFVALGRSRKSDCPGAAGFVRGYASAALPTATVLLTVYAVVAVGTLHLEANKRTEMEQMLASEDRYLADLAHQPLPGFSSGQRLRTN